MSHASARVITSKTKRIRLKDMTRDFTLIRVVTGRDLRVKYKQSLLGPAWLVIQPVALLAGFLLAFSTVGNTTTEGTPYVLYALAGLSVWSFFQAALNMGAPSMISNRSLVVQTPCPRYVFPLSAAISTLPSLAVTYGTTVVAALIAGELSWRVCLFPLALVWLGLMIFGLVAAVSILAARFRDILSGLPLVVQAGVLLTPVGYSTADLPDAVYALMVVNPLTGLIAVWRWVTLSSVPLDETAAGISALVSLLICVAGWMALTRMEGQIADEI